MGFIAGVSAAYAIASAVVRSRTQWPPDFPRRGTLLTPRDDPTTPRSEWGAREWKAYAQFLEEEGSQRVKQLTQAEAELRTLRKKLSRRKNAPATTLLGGSPSQSRRGRPPSEKWLIAQEALSIKKEMEEDAGRKIVDRQALALYYERRGMRKQRADAIGAQTILNAMSKLRRTESQKQKNSGR